MSKIKPKEYGVSPTGKLWQTEMGIPEFYTYISLFSGAGVGCYGFKEESFYCIASVELLERRLKIQSYNQKCAYESGYISGDLTTDEVKEKIFAELSLWKKRYNIRDLDVLIATPPAKEYQ